MALSYAERQVQWNTGNNTGTVTGDSQLASDLLSLPADVISRAVTLKADKTTGDPTAGNQTWFYLMATAGDPDGSVDDEYPASEANAEWLATIDHSVEDPGVVFRTLPVPAKGCKIFAKTLGMSGGDVVTVSATILDLVST